MKVKAGPNIGHSSRLDYDKCAYPDKLEESVYPGDYRLDTNAIYNCDGSLTTIGPRGSFGVSTEVGKTIADKQKLVDVDSLLSNRNVKQTKCKSGRVNNIDLDKIKLKNINIQNNNVEQYSKITNPSSSYRSLPLNRFYTLPIDPQANIFYDFSVNTSLEAKDNLVPGVPNPMKKDNFPSPLKGKGKSCNKGCTNNKSCSTKCK
tara:strand:- start:979 stop:1590 length:612 start_codon:yes stop_codon:yes gene_type:complete